MEIREMFLPEFDLEMKKTRAILERVPEGKQDFKPHEKSMALGKLAGHTAQLPEFAVRIVELPELDFSKSDMKPLVMESRQQLLDAFDSIAAKARAAIAGASDEHWEKKWKLSFQGHTIVDEPRFLVYRGLFLNHIIHHRAQLGVYLRLNDVPLPATYGPSADDTMGF
ncbi:MAG: DinB family protein [Acidobacteriaceae bacterium]